MGGGGWRRERRGRTARKDLYKSYQGTRSLQLLPVEPFPPFCILFKFGGGWGGGTRECNEGWGWGVGVEGG